MWDSRKIYTWFGIVLIIIIGFIHVIEAPDCFEEAAYKGWLFYANGAGALVASYGIFWGMQRLGWDLGFLIAAGSIIGYVMSRTVGLPSIPAEPDAWFEPLGLASLVAEGVFVLLVIVNALADKQAREEAKQEAEKAAREG